MTDIKFVFNPENNDIQKEREYYIKNPTELCLYGLKYRSDKTPILGHTYTPIYYKLFNGIRNEIKIVVELGLGDRPGCNGASLKMWRDFFKNAEVYGLDNNQLLMITDERIKTCFTDQRSFDELLNTRNYLISWSDEIRNRGIDIFIDDGSHGFDDQMRTLIAFWKLIRPGGFFIIEDIYLKGWYPGVEYTFETYKNTLPGEIMDFCNFSVYKTSEDNHLIIYQKKH